MKNADKNFIELYKIFSFIVWSIRSSFKKDELLSIIQNIKGNCNAELVLADFVSQGLIAKSLFGKYVLTEEGNKFWIYLNDIAQQFNSLKLHKHKWINELRAKGFPQSDDRCYLN